MKKSSKFVLVTCIVTVFVLIILFQLLRTDTLDYIFAPETKQVQRMTTMTHDVKAADAGEQLTVSILGDAAESAANPIVKNIMFALTYAKIPFEFKRPDEVASIRPSPYQILLVADEKSNEWPYEAIRTFVEKGGRFFVATRYLNPKWNELIGIAENNGFFNEPIFGITFEKTLFPAYPSVSSESGAFPNSMLDVKLSPKADVYVTAERVPMLWTHTYGAGKVVYWNATFLSDKQTRGLITQSLALAPPAFVSGQAAAKIMFIDDFPAPVPSGSVPSIQRDYHMPTSDFYERVWWEDMKTIAKENDIRFTNVFIGTYENKADLTSEQLIEQMKEHMLHFGRQSLQLGYELGFHGYNHQSLVTRDEPIDPALGYVPWESQTHMEEAIQTGEELFRYYFPNQPLYTYVPPSNVLNETGVRALVNMLPNLQVISALYDGSYESGVFVQEFEFDETYKGLYHLPRISSGYVQSPVDDFVMKDAIANFGVFSHFVHPDDVLDEVRSEGKGWSELKADFDELVKDIVDQYSYMKPYTAVEAMKKLSLYQHSELNVYYADDAITISGRELVNPSNVIVRLEQGKQMDTGSFDGYEVKRLGTESVYAVTFTKPFITIRVKDED